MLEDKVKEAEQVLKLAADMSKAYYNKPLIVSYSGGKDSDVMLDIAKRCLDPDTFEVVNNHTTVDAPETVYHIRKVFADCETRGIHTEVLRPEFRGERTSMWKLIELNGVPPTRLARYCCRILKERTIPDRMIAIGVREAESVGRQGKDSFAIRGKTKEDAEYRSLQHTYAMFKLDQMGKEDAYECVFIQACKANKSTIVNPIYHFTDSEIWEYVRTYNVPMNPLYERGYKRVGCIGCPLGGGVINKDNNSQIFRNTRRTIFVPLIGLSPNERRKARRTHIRTVKNGCVGGRVKTLTKSGLKTY